MHVFLKISDIKKTILLALFSLFYSNLAVANNLLLGADAGIELMYLDVKGGGTSESTTTQSVYAKYDHFLPFIPNGSIRTTQYSSDYASFTKTDTTAYYSFLGNALSTLDVGISKVNYGSTSGNAANFSGESTQIYANAAVNFAPTPLTIFAQGHADSNMNIIESRIGVAYNLSLAVTDISIKLGQYQLNNTCNCSDVGISGWFLGASGGLGI